ncbi:MAG: SNF2-related protein [Turicibacter sp.]|nr:SNF2-related protein [Turicibacter sp.]
MLVITKKAMQQYQTNDHYKRMATTLSGTNALQALEIDEERNGIYEVRAAINDQVEFEISLHLTQDGRVEKCKYSSYIFRPQNVYILFILMSINKFAPKHLPFIFHSETHLWKREMKYRTDADETTTLIESYKVRAANELVENILTGNHQIKTFLSDHRGSLKLKFKVGAVEKTQYVVKNIQSFLTDVTRSSYVSYGKNLAFKHAEANFDDTSKLIIQFMRKMIANQLSNDHQYEATIKDLTLTNGVIDDFFVTFEQVSHTHRDFYLDDSSEYPIIQIEQLDGYYRMKLRTKYRYVLGQNHLYHLDGRVLVRTKLDLAGKTISLLYKLSRQGGLIVRDVDFNDFYTYVLSDIKNFVQIEGFAIDVTTENEIDIYADVDETDEVYVKIIYHYEGSCDRVGFDDANTELSLAAHKIESYIKSHATIDKASSTAYVRGDNRHIQAFIHAGLSYLQQYANVYVSESLKQMGKKTRIQMTAGVTIKNDLLSIDLDSIDIPRDELADVLAAYRRKKKFHKLKNGERIYLDSDELEEVDKMLESYQVDPTKIIDGHIDLDLFRAFSINERAQSDYSLIDFNRSDLFKDVIARFENIDVKSYEINQRYGELLRDYQKYGYQWLRLLSDYGFGGILADDMGLGKTLQVIALLDQHKKEGQVSIVVAPASLILNWEDEVKKFAPDLRAVSVYGSASARQAVIKCATDYELLITSYDYIRRDFELYNDFQFEYVILDEAQYIKNQKTKSALSVKELRSKHRLVLTGTPIENSLAELWSIFDFLMPGYLYPYAYFAREYERPIVREKDEQKQMALRKLISPFILRRRKADVLQELPDKIETTMPIEFSEAEKKLYLANLSQVNVELQDKLQMNQVNAIAILAMLTRLRQICCEPRVLYENVEGPSSKLQACMELITQLRENGKKVLLFSSFTSVLDLLHAELDEAGVSHYTLTGSTDKVKRRELVGKFQNDDTGVFLISLKAGGTGLNLTAAEAVIHYDPWWNMSAQNQATDRAHRIGQENTVQVFKLIMKDSIEEKIQLLQEAKKDLADAFVEGNDGTITSMSREDIMALFMS